MQGTTRVVLLQPPLHPTMLERGAKNNERHAAVMEELKSRLGVEYWDLTQEAQVVASDFHDWGHLGNPDARVRFGKALARRLVPLLAEVSSKP